MVHRQQDKELARTGNLKREVNQNLKQTLTSVEFNNHSRSFLNIHEQVMSNDDTTFYGG